MNCLATAQVGAIFAPFITPFFVEGANSWLGWCLLVLFLALILVPAIGVPVVVNTNDDAETFFHIILAESILAGFYIVFWIALVATAFTRWRYLM